MSNGQKIIKNSDSKEPLREWTSNAITSSLLPNFSFQEVLNMIDADPIARGAVNAYVDKFMEGGWNTIKEGKINTEFKKLLDSMNFDNAVLRKLALHGKIFNNAFLEIIKDSRGTKALNVLDPLNIEPLTAPNGDPISYKTATPNPVNGHYSTWTTKEISWFKFGDRNGGFAPVDISALFSNLWTKVYVMRFVTWLYQTGQYRVVYNFKNASGKVLDDFVVYNNKNDKNFSKPFLAGGEMEAKVLRDMKEIDSLTAFVSKLDSDTLVLLRVSPSEAGLPDGSGRSNADAQLNSFNTHIKSQKKIIKGTLNNDTFYKMNHGNDQIVFSPNDRFEMTQILENLVKLKSVGFTDEASQEYLQSTGVYFKTTSLFDAPEETPNSDTATNITSPSRQGTTEGMASKKIGTGEQASTREDQLVKNSQPSKNNWTYDVVKEGS